MKYYVAMRSWFVTNGVLCDMVIKDGLVIGRLEDSGVQMMIPLTSVVYIKEHKEGR